MSEQLLAEEIQLNRLAQMRAITYLLLAACEGLISCTFSALFARNENYLRGSLVRLNAVFDLQTSRLL